MNSIVLAELRHGKDRYRLSRLVTGVLLSVLLPFFHSSGASLTIQAEEAHIKTVGAGSHGVWNLWSYGEWGDFVRFAKPGTCTVRVRYYGSPANSVWPEMAFSVDRVIRERVTVATNQPADYVFTFDVEAREYRLAVSFMNDARTKTEDRNLYVISLSIESPDKGQAVTLTTEQSWRNWWTQDQLRRENEIVTRAVEAIEKNRKRDAKLRVVYEDGHPADDVSLLVEQVRHDFLFGANIYRFDRFGTERENELYKERFRELFNYATTGFYWRWYEREQGKPDYAYTDKVVAWGRQNNIRMKGHPLLWACESGIPPWCSEQPPAELRRQRIAEIMTRYAGKIEFWEVVNEPAHLSGLEIDEPYRFARQVDPKACLIVNDYEVMADGYPPFFNLLEKALSRGVPFDAIGIQAHEPRTMRFPLEQVWKTLDYYATLGKPIHITEFTPPSGGQEITGSHIVGKWDESAQADYAVKFYTVCFAHPAVAAITWWDLSDAGSWLWREEDFFARI